MCLTIRKEDGSILDAQVSRVKRADVGQVIYQDASFDKYGLTFSFEPGEMTNCYAVFTSKEHPEAVSYTHLYGRYEAYVRICTKCLLAFLVFYMIHSQLSGSMNPRSWAEIVVATLIAVMIPIDACSILVAIFVIVHMLMISVEAGVIAAAFFLFLLLTYFIFKPRQSILITVMCLVGMLNLTGAAAIPIGLLCGPIARCV